MEAIAISVASEQDLAMRTDLAMKTLATNFQASTKAGVKKSNRNVTKGDFALSFFCTLTLTDHKLFGFFLVRLEFEPFQFSFLFTTFFLDFLFMLELLDIFILNYFFLDSKTETKEPAATEDLDAVEAYLNSVQIMDYSSANNKDQKEKSRRKRINSSLEYLRKLVPGIGTDTDQSEVYAQTARYVSFLRQLASKKNIEDFISENVLAI